MDKAKLLEEIKSDRRTTGQIFKSLQNKLIRSSNGKITDDNATEATRNLIGLFETVLKVPSEKRSNGLEDE